MTLVWGGFPRETVTEKGHAGRVGRRSDQSTFNHSVYNLNFKLLFLPYLQNKFYL
jgi:hypothetical protein